MTNNTQMDYSFDDSHKAVEEQAVDKFRLDVGILNSGDKVVAAVEIYHTHRVDDAKLNALKQKDIMVIEVIAQHVITAFENDCWMLTYKNKQDCKECLVANRKKQEEKRKKEFVKINKCCIQCSKWKALANVSLCYPPIGYSYNLAYVCSSCCIPCPLCKGSCYHTQIKDSGRCNRCIDDERIRIQRRIEKQEKDKMDEDIPQQPTMNSIRNYFKSEII